MDESRESPFQPLDVKEALPPPISAARRAAGIVAYAFAVLALYWDFTLLIALAGAIRDLGDPPVGALWHIRSIFIALLVFAAGFVWTGRTLRRRCNGTEEWIIFGALAAASIAVKQFG